MTLKRQVWYVIYFPVINLAILNGKSTYFDSFILNRLQMAQYLIVDYFVPSWVETRSRTSVSRPLPQLPVSARLDCTIGRVRGTCAQSTLLASSCWDTSTLWSDFKSNRACSPVRWHSLRTLSCILSCPFLKSSKVKGLRCSRIWCSGPQCHHH
jgi:hypothetical protein